MGGVEEAKPVRVAAGDDEDEGAGSEDIEDDSSEDDEDGDAEDMDGDEDVDMAEDAPAAGPAAGDVKQPVAGAAEVMVH
jgi:histone chaperone ASF1